MSLTAVPLNVQATESEVIITQEGQFECYKVTFEGCGHYVPIDYITEAGIDFSDNWKTLTHGSYSNNPSGVAIAFWRIGNYADIILDEPVAMVGFYYSSRADTIFEAFDEQNNLVGMTSGPSNAPFGYFNWDPLSVSVDVNSIKWIRIYSEHNRCAIDDLKVCRVSLTAGDLLEDITINIETQDIDEGTSNSLISKVNNAMESLDKGQNGAAVNKLNALINELEAQSDKKLSKENTDAIISMALLATDIIKGNTL
jgi:hypothetical protein